MRDYTDLKKAYNSRKNEIRSRLEEFRKIGAEGSEARLFKELCFCLLTPQAKAKLCWEAVNDLEKKGLLSGGKAGNISPLLNKVRFKNNKARNVCLAREKFARGAAGIRPLLIANKDERALRNWLADNVMGYGLKEASHFLRNIGLGENIAILDRHILKNLRRWGVIKEVPKHLGRKTYFEIESRMLEFARRIKIPASHLDLLFWSMETGEIFK